jgi:transposase
MWTGVMIVLGADTHKRSHTLAAINVATGQVLGEETVQVGPRGFATLLGWARELDGQRVWALEDCRHVSGALERFLLGRGERVVRVLTRLMAASRRSSRQRGKSDQIDAVSVARAALAAGIETLPTAALAGVELHIRLLVDHRERLVGTRVALNSTLQGNLHDPVARAGVAWRRVVLQEVDEQDRPALGARRADDARAHRARRVAPRARADPHHQRARDPRSPTWSPRSRRGSSPSAAAGR